MCRNLPNLPKVHNLGGTLRSSTDLDLQWKAETVFKKNSNWHNCVLLQIYIWNTLQFASSGEDITWIGDLFLFLFLFSISHAGLNGYMVRTSIQLWIRIIFPPPLSPLHQARWALSFRPVPKQQSLIAWYTFLRELHVTNGASCFGELDSVMRWYSWQSINIGLVMYD